MKIPAYIFIAVILIVSAATDLRTRKIPNWLTYTSMLLALAFHFYADGSTGLIFSIKGLSLGMGVFLIPYLLGGMGAGDAKLMGAVGAVLGAKGVFIAILYSAIVGGIYALGLMALRYCRFQGFFGQVWEGLKNSLLTQKFVPGPVDETRPKLCYGVAIALGTFAYLGLEISKIGQIL